MIPTPGESYSTRDEMKLRGWTVRYADLAPIGEVFVSSSRLILLDRRIIDHELAEAHALVHLDYGEPDGAAFTIEEERTADEIARFRLGRADALMFDLPPVDGDPSVAFDEA